MAHAWIMRFDAKNSMSIYMNHAWNSHGPCMQAHGLPTRVVFQVPLQLHHSGGNGADYLGHDKGGGRRLWTQQHSAVHDSLAATREVVPH